MQIRRIRGADVLAVCDTEPLMAQQMCERFHVPQYFTDVKEMLDAVSLDVVHVIAPPQTHFDLGRACLEAGSSVYIEKPFTLTTFEAEELICLATQNGVRLTAGHNAQFTHAMVRMRDLIRTGFLGGPPVHMESIYCYDLSDTGYAQAVLRDGEHWARKLPGSLLHNIISHGISKIAEFLPGDTPFVVAHSFTSPFLKKSGQGDLIDEVRVMIQGDDATTAYFTFSSQIRPPLHQFRLYGPSNSLIVDDNHQTVIQIRNTEYKSYARYFVPPLDYAKQYMGNLSGNVSRFLRRDFHLPFDAGLKRLIESFYQAVLGRADVPLPYREILLTSRIMDEIFGQMPRVAKVVGRPAARSGPSTLT
jgi:predicted dehydrogenase